MSLSQIAEARVFNFKNETIAGYFRGSTSLSRLGTTPFDNASGNSTVFTGEDHAYNYSGEIGFLLNIGDFATFRVGAELIQSKESEVVGSSAGGTKYFDLVSDVFVFNTTGTLEYHIFSTDTTRLSLFGGVGLGSISMDLDYTFTSAGLSAFSLSSDYTEKTTSYIIGAHAGAQYEFLFADTVTMALEAGFRHLPVPKLDYKEDAATIYGAVTKGSRAKNQDGTNRTLDLSGYYVGLGFRFYLDFL
ncbi:MAG: hypothetical protein KDD58_07285 [Bdellovibrionales bacterium]|nr:hypothetical protein [Bdellovibrionales bacterium]